MATQVILLVYAYLTKRKEEPKQVILPNTLLLSAIFCRATSMVLTGDVPTELIECVHELDRPWEANTSAPGSVFDTRADIHTHCLQQFLWKKDRIKWTDFNVTQSDMDYINSLTNSLLQGGRRTKRQAGPRGPRRGSIFPRTGFRVRREYRRLSDMERMAFHAALNRLKRTGRYDVFANLHRGTVVTSAHGGPNFFGWHRVFLALFEEALRRVNRRVSLPYWDSTLDFHMENPVNSIVWTRPFLGNGDGAVTSGPFARWPTPIGPLTRNIGEGSTLFSTAQLRRVLSRCRTREISEPTAQVAFNFERYHGGPHVWVGGQMSGLNTAAHDPVFFLHHAFVDYIWELFRIRQARLCGVDPTTDYPRTAGVHAARRPMDGLPPYLNMDGYRGYWTRFWYRYEPSPQCSMRRPYCGSPYLRCDMRRSRCVSVARRVAPGGPEAVGGAFAAINTANSPMAARGRMQANSLPIGPKFAAPPAEPRTQDALMMTGRRRFRRQAMNVTTPMATEFDNKPLNTLDVGPTFNAPPSGSLDVGPTFNAPPAVSLDVGPTFIAPPSGSLDVGPTFNAPPSGSLDVGPTFTAPPPGSMPGSLDVGPKFNAPPSDGRTSDVLGRNIASGIRGIDSVNRPNLFDDRRSPFPFMPLIPAFYFGQQYTNDMLRPPFRNSFSLNGVRDTTQWVYLPVKVVHKPNYSVSMRGNRNPATAASRRASWCMQDDSGAMQVKVQAQGLNYAGSFTKYALIDSNLPIDSGTVYIAVKSPYAGVTEALITGVHSCGRMCQPLCRGNSSPDNSRYSPCTGAIRLTAQDTNVFGRSYDEAVNKVWQRGQAGITENMDSIRVILECTRDDISPWTAFNMTSTANYFG